MGRRRVRAWLLRMLLLGLTAALLGLTVHLVGAGALLAGGEVLNPLTVIAALACGLLATVAQALRFRLLLRRGGTRISTGSALADCYSAGLLNMVLPGGLGGDLARVAVYRDAGRRRWWSPLTVVGAERLSATTLLFLTASLALLPVVPIWSGLAAAIAVLTAVLSLIGMRGLATGTAVLVWATAAVTMGSFLGLYLIAMTALGGPVVPALAVVGLAAMSVPVGVGGWGVRELSVTLVAGSFGTTMDWAATSATGYGLLAIVSTLPGLLTLLLRLWRRRAEPGPVRTDPAPSR